MDIVFGSTNDPKTMLILEDFPPLFMPDLMWRLPAAASAGTAFAVQLDFWSVFKFIFKGARI